MSEEADQQPRPAKRGEAAWKAAREAVAERNDETRKAGKKERADYERHKADARREAERRQLESFPGRQRKV